MKSMGTSDEFEGESDEESLVLAVSDWAAGSEYCRLMNL